MTALVCIDGRTDHVRRYETRRPGGRVYVTGEGILVRSSPTLLAGLEAFRAEGVCGDPFPQDHIPPAAA